MTTTPPPDDLFAWAQRDICKNKHRGNPESVAGFNKAKQTLVARNRQALRLIVSAGNEGMTVHELCEVMESEPHKVSGIGTQLKAGGYVIKIGTRINEAGNKCGVLVATEKGKNYEREQ